MVYDFDAVRKRRGTDSLKWGKYGEDVLPLWVADMDFPSAEPILRALHQRVEEGFFGYTQPPQELRLLIQERLARLYHWHIQEEELLFLPSLVTGLNLSYLAFTTPGDGVLVQPPVYHHFVKDPILHGRNLIDPPLVLAGGHYEIDFEAFEGSINERTRVLLLCNPHNPVGRVFTRQELARVAQICLRHGLIISSDEIHCDLLYPGYHHLPIATLSPEIADRTITLMSFSKTHNLAGLGCAFAIIPNPELRRRWMDASTGIVPGPTIMGHVATLAALKEGGEWLEQVLLYLTANRDFLANYVQENLPGIQMSRVEATYLAWLDCRGASIPGNPFEFFLQAAKVALMEGKEFGKGGDGFVRLNFACPRKILTEALHRMAAALEKL
ncbi:MAG: PatB family C-S lyase [candidate division NC10 bacterium]|nr:PatB family C-S lyase [candidate division NC10 bacterium]